MILHDDDNGDPGLAAERRLFAERRRLQARVIPPPPAWRPMRRADGARRGVAATLAAASLVLFTWTGNVPAPGVTAAEPGGECGASWLSTRWCETAEDGEPDEVAVVEERFGACLWATPG